MSDKEFYERIRQIEANLKIIEAYDEMFGQVKQVADIINNESEGKE